MVKHLIFQRSCPRTLHWSTKVAEGVITIVTSCVQELRVRKAAVVAYEPAWESTAINTGKDYQNHTTAEKILDARYAKDVHRAKQYCFHWVEKIQQRTALLRLAESGKALDR